MGWWLRANIRSNLTVSHQLELELSEGLESGWVLMTSCRIKTACSNCVKLFCFWWTCPSWWLSLGVTRRWSPRSVPADAPTWWWGCRWPWPCSAPSPRLSLSGWSAATGSSTQNSWSPVLKEILRKKNWQNNIFTPCYSTSTVWSMARWKTARS